MASKWMTAAAATVALLGTAAAVQAAPISAGSSLSFTGTANCTATACTILDSSNAFNSNSTLNVATGDYAAAGFDNGQGANLSSFTYNPFSAFTPYTVFSGINFNLGPLNTSASFDATGLVSAVRTDVGNGLFTTNITFSGIARLEGFDPTAGLYVFTANQFGRFDGTFSSTSTVNVPEPASLALLGAGLLGLSCVNRRKAKKASEAASAA